MRRWAAVALAAGLVPPASAASVAPLPGAEACPMFPADSHWHADVSGLPVHPQSDTWVASVGAGSGLKADFGSGLWDGGPIGIPYTTVGSGQPPVAVTFQYADESDPGPWPVPANPPIEGGPQADGDRHVLVVDRDRCVLHELYSAYPNGDGSWRAGSGAIWDLRTNALRPPTWTSADAAGLPVLPGLVRYDEVAAGEIDHAIRVTAPATRDEFVWPARHEAGYDDASLPPMGARFRLKAGVDISRYPPADQVILRALKKHGLILADNGSPWFMSGVPDERWDNEVLHGLRGIRGSDFEAVDASSLMVHPDSGAVASSPAVAAARLYGSGRVETAVALSRDAYATGAPAVVIANDQRFPDALAAAPLAAAVGGPVLLNPQAGLHSEVAAEVRRLGATTAFLLGGPAAQSDAVAGGLAGLGLRVERLAGEDRFGTAAAVSLRAVQFWRAGGDAGAGRELLIALGLFPGNDGRAWPDALAAGPLAGHGRRPLLLVRPDGVPPATAAAVASLDPDSVVAAGGPAAIPDAVLQSIGGEGTTRARIGGVDRYATAALLAAAAEAEGADGGIALVATGRAFPDGLAAGPAATERGGVVLLTDRDQASPPAVEHLSAHAVSWLRVAGGPAAVSDAVVAALLAAAS